MRHASDPGSARVPDAQHRGGRRTGDALFAFLATLWLGVVLGVSFVATPVKFQAPALDLPTALEVGRVTFALLSKIEWGLCVLLIAAALPAQRSRALRLGGAGALALILVVQAAWLLPRLDARVGQIIAGGTVPATSHHLLYIAAEVLKVLLLLGLSVEALRGLARSRPSAGDA